MATAEPELGAWEGTSVDVASIEAALARLWRRSGQAEAEDGRQLPARTSVMNLIVYVPHEDGVASAVEAIGALSDRHPSRTILVVADPDAPTSSLDASVSAQCSLVSLAGGRLCWEQITVRAHGATAAHVPGVVIPLLLPDLATYLWWADDVPFGTTLFDRMTDLCDRVIVDSAHFARPINGLVRLAALSHTTPHDRGVSDFHWRRVTPWRTLLAQFYDKEEVRPYAYRVDTVQVGYAHDEHGGMAQALLLVGWLASRLGWVPRPQATRLQGDTLQLEATNGADGNGAAGTPVTITIAPRPPAGAAAGDVVALAMRATLRDVPATFSIERRAEDDSATATTTIGGAEGVEHTVRMAARSPGELLAEELDLFRHDRVYEAALDAVAGMCERVVTEER